MNRRVEKIRDQFDQLRVDAFVVTFLPHLRYVSGFSGSNGLAIITRTGMRLVTDGRYAQQIRKETKGWTITITQDDLFDAVKKLSVFRDGMRIGFDGNALSFAQYQHVKKLFPKVKFLPRANTIERIAAVKDANEIARIRKAVEITDTVFKEILPLLKPGVSESDIAAEISYRQKKHGAEGDGFETIVASGLRSALPHGRASMKKLARGEFITLDFGCVYEGYHSDLTRTVALGKLSAEAKKMYQVVSDAQRRAIDAARSGMKAKELDSVARTHIKSKGYEKYFRHGLGHGLGLQIHEPPRVSFNSTATLKVGNVITIEPGIYIPSLGGVRIEDDIVIGDGRSEILNRAPKHLMIL
jgi:Xaa-Pro aminopeptidase